MKPSNYLTSHLRIWVSIFCTSSSMVDMDHGLTKVLPCTGDLTVSTCNDNMKEKLSINVLLYIRKEKKIEKNV